MRIASIILGLLLAGQAQAQTAHCRFLEQIVLMEYGLAEGQACHALYLDCLAHPFVKDDAIPKTRCIEILRCGAKFWVPIPHGVSSVSNLEIFKQDCEPE
ncbi:MAG: hypothetical protein KJ850_03455 [Gammaproteobacteria bacterium]|nr:hypothetical protein [Gammaproteobacteria bacterium]MBU1624084.1 hypothetical protein [Gammaproteobacteria bacterium]MBU1981812.1 hypothetical protein [Gammaproteobacteria bacterium]